MPSPQGNGSIKGYLARPASASGKLPGILVVHENRGLNPHIEDVARRIALENFIAFAPDGLTSVGGYPGDDDKGGELFRTVDRAKMMEDFLAAARWLKARPDCTGKIGATGFCFGGGVVNTPGRLMGADIAAVAPYYGQAPAAADVPKIKAAVLVHHGETDTRLVEAWPAYEAALKAAGVTLRGAHLSRRRPRLQQRRDPRALQQSRGRSGLETHYRVVQSVRPWLTSLQTLLAASISPPSLKIPGRVIGEWVVASPWKARGRGSQRAAACRGPSLTW